MQQHTFHLSTEDRMQLYVQVWQPFQKPKAVICLVHGIGEHSSRYHKWAEQFVQQNYAVISFDQRGHGLSSGKRGVISSYQNLMDDIDRILEEANNLFQDIPCFLYGHSMGGGEVLNHLIRRKSNYLGVISTSPWIITQAAPPKIAMLFLRLLNKLIPLFRIKTSFDSKMLSHNEEVARKYNEDKLVHHMVSFRLFVDAYDAGYHIMQNSAKITKPLLLLHGSDDQITDPQASKKIAAEIPNCCTFIEYEKAYHELHNDFCSNQAFSDIVKWLELQLITNN